MPDSDPDHLDEFDEAMTRELGHLSPGIGLREAIIDRYRRGRRVQFVGMISSCAVAVLFVLFMAHSLPWTAPGQRVAAATYMKDAVIFIESGFQLAAKRPGKQVLQDLYHTIAPATALQLPDDLADTVPAGCRTVDIDGVEALLVCYYLENGEQLHLFVISDPARLRGVTADQPEFESHGHWISAAWRQDDTVYVAVATGDPAQVRQLLVRHGRRLFSHWS